MFINERAFLTRHQNILKSFKKNFKNTALPGSGHSKSNHLHNIFVLFLQTHKLFGFMINSWSIYDSNST